MSRAVHGIRWYSPQTHEKVVSEHANGLRIENRLSLQGVPEITAEEQLDGLHWVLCTGGDGAVQRGLSRKYPRPQIRREFEFFVTSLAKRVGDTTFQSLRPILRVQIPHEAKRLLGSGLDNTFKR